MTERRPHGITTGDWVERQIREAEQRGDFTGLHGAGKPLDLSDAGDEMAQVAKVVRRAGADPSDFLPPALRLAKQVEDLQDRLRREPTEARARAYVEELNREIRAEIPKPQTGPPMRARPVDVDAVMAQWAVAKAARIAALAPVVPAAAAEATRARRSWFGRRTRRG